MDVAACLAALGEMGYDGPVTVVPASGALKQQRRDLVVKEVADSLQRAWKAAGLGPTGKPLAAARALEPSAISFQQDLQRGRRGDQQRRRCCGS